MPNDLPDANTLPVSKRKKRNGTKKQPATQAERDAVRFAAIKAEFDWTNEEWAETWLPWIRMAAVHVHSDDELMKEGMRSLVAEGQAPNILEGFTRAKKHLEALEALLEAALSRSFLTLERLGYSPDNLPPDSKLN